MNNQTITCKHCQFENPAGTHFCAGCGVRFSKSNRIATIGKAIFRRSFVRNGIVLIYAATPVLIAVLLYTGTDWANIPSTCSWGGSFICGEDFPSGFVLDLMFWCLMAAAAYLVIGLIVATILSVGARLMEVDTEPARPVLVGMGLGSGAATITLIVSCVVGFFLVGSVDLEKGAWSRNALKQARDNNAYSAVTLQKLTEKGTDVDARDTGGQTLLHYATRDGEVEVVRTLIKAEADVNARNSRGLTPLLSAVNGGSSEALPTLIEAGADVNAKTSSGWTPLHYALFHGSSEAARMLIDGGADVNARNDDRATPLDFALSRDRGSVESVRMLVDAGADVNPKTKLGEFTPLRLALYYGPPESVRILVNAGADVNAEDNFGETPLDYALEYRASPEVRQMLIDAGAKPR